MDNYKLLNFLNFNDIGSSSIQEMNAFKKIRMFSKIYTSNLTFIPNNYSSKYKALSSLYINDSIFTDSYLYGLKRQHNFLSTNALLNNQSTFLNLKSANKFINFNFKNNYNIDQTLNQQYENNTFKYNNYSNINASSLKINSFFNKFSSNDSSSFLNNSILYPSYLNLINNNSDKFKSIYPIYKLFNTRLKKHSFSFNSNLNELNNYTDLSVFESTNEPKSFFFNKTSSFKNLTLFSSNQWIPLTGRFVRNFVQNSPSSSHYNYSTNLNTLNDYLFDANSSLGLNNFFFFNSANSD
jgi:hypothetical protein